MSRLKFFLAAMLISGSAALALSATTRPATPRPAATRPTAVDRRPPRLVQPWSWIGSLTENQKQKIAAIHQAALEEIRAIQRREDEQCLSVLSDSQRAELLEAEEADAARRKSAARPRP